MEVTPLNHFYSCVSTTVILGHSSSGEQRALFTSRSVGNGSHKKTVKCIHSAEMKSLLMCDSGFPMPTHSKMSPLQREREEYDEQESDKKEEKKGMILLLGLWSGVGLCTVVGVVFEQAG